MLVLLLESLPAWSVRLERIHWRRVVDWRAKLVAEWRQRVEDATRLADIGASRALRQERSRGHLTDGGGGTSVVVKVSTEQIPATAALPVGVEHQVVHHGQIVGREELVLHWQFVVEAAAKVERLEAQV